MPLEANHNNEATEQHRWNNCSDLNMKATPGVHLMSGLARIIQLGHCHTHYHSIKCTWYVFFWLDFCLLRCSVFFSKCKCKSVIVRLKETLSSAKSIMTQWKFGNYLLCITFLRWLWIFFVNPRQYMEVLLKLESTRKRTVIINIFIRASFSHLYSSGGDLHFRIVFIGEDLSWRFAT